MGPAAHGQHIAGGLEFGFCAGGTDPTVLYLRVRGTQAVRIEAGRVALDENVTRTTHAFRADPRSDGQRAGHVERGGVGGAYAIIRTIETERAAHDPGGASRSIDQEGMAVVS